MSRGHPEKIYQWAFITPEVKCPLMKKKVTILLSFNHHNHQPNRTTLGPQAHFASLYPPKRPIFTQKNWQSIMPAHEPPTLGPTNRHQGVLSGLEVKRPLLENKPYGNHQPFMGIVTILPAKTTQVQSSQFGADTSFTSRTGAGHGLFTSFSVACTYKAERQPARVYTAFLISCICSPISRWIIIT